jgi:hypothetical protein
LILSYEFHIVIKHLFVSNRFRRPLFEVEQDGRFFLLNGHEWKVFGLENFVDNIYCRFMSVFDFQGFHLPRGVVFFR